MSVIIPRVWNMNSTYIPCFKGSSSNEHRNVVCQAALCHYRKCCCTHRVDAPGNLQEEECSPHKNSNDGKGLPHSLGHVPAWQRSVQVEQKCQCSKGQREGPVTNVEVAHGTKLLSAHVIGLHLELQVHLASH